MSLTPTGFETTFTRKELLRLRNMNDTNDTELEPESQDCNAQGSEPDDSSD